MALRAKANNVVELQSFDETTSAFGAVIKRLRLERGLSLEALSKTAGISIGALSQIERGQGNPSLRTLTALRFALGADVDDLFGEAPEPPEKDKDPDFVTRVANRPRLELGYVSKQLLSRSHAHSLHFMILDIAPRASSGDKPLSYPAEKGGLVLSGQLILKVGQEEALLQEGDSFRFDSSVPHGFQNPTDDIVKVLWIIGAVHLDNSL
jgi:transcriptional regulator with XRE-family HTH domain